MKLRLLPTAGTPWVNDIAKELQRKKDEQLDGLDEYQSAFRGGADAQ